MKICIICLMLVMAVGSAQSQVTTTSTPTPTKQDLLKKSKSQKTAAWILLAGGGTLFVLGTMDTDDNNGYSDDTRKGALIVTGLAAVSVSTVLFIASSRNKRNAQSMSFKMERAPVLQQNGLAYSSYPALSLKIKL